MLSACRRIWDIAQAGIDRGEIPEGTHVRATMEGILSDTRNVLQYKRQRRNNEVKYS